jgi:hypothetical protein
VRLTGQWTYEPELRRAVHAGSGAEACADGRPIEVSDENPQLRAQADAVEAELGGLLEISVRFGIWYAKWRNGAGVGQVGHNADEARRRLRAAVLEALRAEYGDACMTGFDDRLGWWAAPRGQIGDVISDPSPAALIKILDDRRGPVGTAIP